MGYKDKDRQFVQECVELLRQRKMINMNEEEGTAHLQPEEYDRINAKLTLSREEIKQATGREKLRDDVPESDYPELFSGYPDMRVRASKNFVEVETVPVREPKNEFSSAKSLAKRNKQDVDKNPELGRDPYMDD